MQAHEWRAGRLSELERDVFLVVHEAIETMEQRERLAAVGEQKRQPYRGANAGSGRENRVGGGLRHSGCPTTPATKVKLCRK